MDYWRTNDICNEYNINRCTVLAWRKKGMPFVKAGRIIIFKKQDVIEWLENQKESVK